MPPTYPTVYWLPSVEYKPTNQQKFIHLNFQFQGQQSKYWHFLSSAHLLRSAVASLSYAQDTIIIIHANSRHKTVPILPSLRA